MIKDKLILLKPGFEDPAYPERKFFCWHCALIEGVLTSFPELAKNIEVERVAWERPRDTVIALVGDQNQSLPLLVLSRGSTTKFRTGQFGEFEFISDPHKILAALSERHGFPESHP